MVDVDYCSSSYLMYRYVCDERYSFSKGLPSRRVDINFERKPVKTADDLLNELEAIVNNTQSKGRMALALSGGMDSAILAKIVPKGTKAYTFRCVVPGKKVLDESKSASEWAKINGLEHEIVDIEWNDIENVVDKLMLHKGAPIHSIEAQIYLASLKVKEQGIEQFIFGENADIIYGGMDGLLKKDWLYGEFVDRYMYVNPVHVLKKPIMIVEPFLKYEKNGHIDGHEFINEYFRQEALGTYTNACETAGVKFVGPYSRTILANKLDYSRIRSGDTKYIVREAFNQIYPSYKMPDKIPMPRPVNEWFAMWSGPTRKEFIPRCTDNMTGNQKWMVWSLERFLNLLDKGEIER